MIATFLTEIVPSDDVRMTERRDDTGFTAQPLNVSLITSKRWLEDLESNNSIQPLMARLENGPHRACTDAIE